MSTADQRLATISSLQLTELLQRLLKLFSEDAEQNTALWDELLDWLAARTAPHAGTVAAVIRRSEDSVNLVAMAPRAQARRVAPPWLAQAANALPEVLQQQQVTLLSVTQSDAMYGHKPTQFLAMVPLPGASDAATAVVVLIDSPNMQHRQRVGELVSVVPDVLRLLQGLLHNQRAVADAHRMRQACEILSAVNSQSKFTAAAMALCNEIAAAYQADRVSFGLLRGRYVKVKAISHTERIKRHMALVQDIEGVMEECLDQDVEVIIPAGPNDDYVCRAHEKLAHTHGAGAVASWPIRVGGETVGVLTIERPHDQPFDPQEVQSLRLTCELTAARLMNLAESDQFFLKRWTSQTRQLGAMLVGPRHTWAKLTAVGLLAVGVLLYFAHGTYRIDAPFEIQAVRQHMIPAPFEGYLQEVHVKPGDTVTAGVTVLASLNTDELRLEKANLEKELQRTRTEAAVALRDGKIAEHSIGQAKAEGLQARIALLEHRIDKASIISPIDGVVLQGDHTQRIDAPVNPEQVLFVVAPLHDLRAELTVDEADMADLLVVKSERGELAGHLASAADPSKYVPFTIEKISPMAEVVEQHNVFRIKVELDSQITQDAPWLRPGMQGLAKVDLDQRRYIWIWTRDMIRWVRMKLWI